MLKVNGKAYDWGDVDVKIPGLAIEVQEIDYDDEFDMEETYGKGNKPRGYGTGNYKSSGKVTVLRDDYESLLAYCKAKGIPFYKLDIPSRCGLLRERGRPHPHRRAAQGQVQQAKQQSRPGRQEHQG